MSDYNNNRPAVASNALKDAKIKLIGDAHEKAIVKYDKPQPPTLAWAIKDNQPRILVYTNVEGDKQDGKIEAAMDAFTAAAILEAIEVYARGEQIDGKKVVDFPCIGYLWTGKGKSEKPMTLATVFVGAADGVVFLSVVSSDQSRPRLKFKLYPTEWHGGVDGQGNQLNSAAISRLYAKGYSRIIGNFLTQLLVTEHKSWQEIADRKGKNQGGGNGGSGGFNRNNGNGGYNRNGNGGAPRQNNNSSNAGSSGGDSGYDDDLPF